MSRSVFQAVLQKQGEVAKAIAADIQALAEAVASIPPERNVTARTLHEPYQACNALYAELEAASKLLKAAQLATLEHQLNVYWYGKLESEFDAKDYEKKKANAKELNDDLRDYQCSVRHPESGQPCYVKAINSEDGNGKYVLHNRITGKRTHTCKSLIDLMPFKFVPEPRRKESLIRPKDESND